MKGKPKVCLKCLRINPPERKTCLTCDTPLINAPTVELDLRKSREIKGGKFMRPKRDYQNGWSASRILLDECDFWVWKHAHWFWWAWQSILRVTWYKLYNYWQKK